MRQAPEYPARTCEWTQRSADPISNDDDFLEPPTMIVNDDKQISPLQGFVFAVQTLASAAGIVLNGGLQTPGWEKLIFRNQRCSIHTRILVH